MLVPIALLSLFSLFIFLLPVQSVGRIGFALFIFAGFFFFILYVQSFEASSKSLPLLSEKDWRL